MELKEAEEKSLKESERLEKEVAEVQELKVMVILLYLSSSFIDSHFQMSLF